jgi:hypothetical protein
MCLSLDPHLASVIDERETEASMSYRFVPFPSDDEELCELQMGSGQLLGLGSLADEADHIAKISGCLDVATAVEAQNSAGQQEIYLGGPDRCWKRSLSPWEA